MHRHEPASDNHAAPPNPETAHSVEAYSRKCAHKNRGRCHEGFRCLSTPKTVFVRTNEQGKPHAADENSDSSKSTNPRSRVARHGTARHGTAQHSTAQHSKQGSNNQDRGSHALSLHLAPALSSTPLPGDNYSTTDSVSLSLSLSLCACTVYCNRPSLTDPRPVFLPSSHGLWV